MWKRLSRIFAAWGPAVVLASCAFAAKAPNLSLYVYGQPFGGSVVVFGRDIYAQAAPLAQALGVPSAEAFPKNMERVFSGKVYVSLLGVAQNHEALLNINWRTGIVDLYSPPRFPSGPVLVLPPSSETAASSESAPLSLSPPYGFPYPPYSPYPPYYAGSYPFPYYYAYPSPAYPPAVPFFLPLPPGVHWNGAFLQDEEGHVVSMHALIW